MATLERNLEEKRTCNFGEYRYSPVILWCVIQVAKKYGFQSYIGGFKSPTHHFYHGQVNRYGGGADCKSAVFMTRVDSTSSLPIIYYSQRKDDPNERYVWNLQN